jgi:hypothetical protein
LCTEHDYRSLGVAFNWLKIGPTNAPTHTIDMQFNSNEFWPLIGTGWHDPESTSEKITFRWSSADTFTLNPFLLSDQPLAITFDLYQALTPELAASLTLAVNGDPITLDWQPYGSVHHFRGVIAQSSLAKSNGGLTTLTFHTAPVISPLSLHEGTDSRNLGVAFVGLVIAPVGTI